MHTNSAQGLFRSSPKCSVLELASLQVKMMAMVVDQSSSCYMCHVSLGYKKLPYWTLEVSYCLHRLAVGIFSFLAGDASVCTSATQPDPSQWLFLCYMKHTVLKSESIWMSCSLFWMIHPPASNGDVWKWSLRLRGRDCSSVVKHKLCAQEIQNEVIGIPGQGISPSERDFSPSPFCYQFCSLLW